MDLENRFQKLQNLYQELKPQIQKRFQDFSSILAAKSDALIFEELVFCLLTPQSKARQAEKIINSLKSEKLLFKAEFEALSHQCRFVRFKNNKARYILEVQEKFINQDISLIQILNQFQNAKEKRAWLFKNIKGLGLKESSHFLRNIALGADLAILDRHILKKMQEYNVVDAIPKTLNLKNYLLLEEKLRGFSRQLKIPFSHLDFVLWYLEGGEIFK